MEQTEVNGNGISNEGIIRVKTEIKLNEDNTDHFYSVSFTNASYADRLASLLFFFVNPKSGSEEGRIILTLADKYKDETEQKFKLIDFNEIIQSRIKQEAQNNHKVKKSSKSVKPDSQKKIEYDPLDSFAVLIFNIIDPEDYENGCKVLKGYIYQSRNESNSNSHSHSHSHSLNVKVIIGGGDGTVLSTIEDMYNRGVDITRCSFGHLPLGTGNDLSNALGFGNFASLNSKITTLRKILLTYHRASSTKVDIWDAKLIVDKDKGEIVEISNESQTPKVDKQNTPVTVYRRPFINYISLGYDASVGFAFEEKRSASRCWNKCIYFWEGCKKTTFRKILPINSFIDSFLVFDDTMTKLPEIVGNDNNNNNTETQMPIECDNTFDDMKDVKKKIVFCSRPSDLSKKNTKYKSVVLKGDPVNIICQNINFYMGGTRDIWKKSGNKIGLKVLNGEKDDLDQSQVAKVTKSEQRFDDQKLEFFTYSSGFKLGFEKVSTGHADKIYHGGGPIIIKFKETPERSELDRHHRVYLNIDGEFFHIIKPIELRIKLNRKLGQGSLNFLENVNNKR